MIKNNKNNLNNFNSFSELTKKIIETELSEGQACNVFKVCEEHYDLWTEELFPILRAQRKSCYDALVEIFHAQGYMNVTAKLLQSYFSRIKKKREAV